MDVNMINPILSAFVEVLPQIGFQSIVKKKISLIGSTLPYSGMLLNIAFLGSVKGVILIGMDLESAKRFASVMMMGISVADFDSMAQSAVSEMGNMVCANACTQFSKAGIAGLDISPPTLMISQDGQVTLPMPKAVSLQFDVDGILVDVHVGLMEVTG